MTADTTNHPVTTRPPVEGRARIRRATVLVGFVVLAVATGVAHGADRQSMVHDDRPHVAGSLTRVAHDTADERCPTRPRFNSVIDTDGGTSFNYRPRQGQVVIGAREKGTARVRALMQTPSGRARLPRIELSTDHVVDERRLPWFAQKIGPRRVVTAILANADSGGYSGVRLAYAPKKGTYAKLILPPGTVRNMSPACAGTVGYPTIYAQNIRRGVTVTGISPVSEDRVPAPLRAGTSRSAPPAVPAAPVAQDPDLPWTPESATDSGPAFRLVLGIPSDQQEPAGAVAAIRHEAEQVTAWFGRQTANGAGPRWVRDGYGRIAVRVVHLPRTTAEYNAGDHDPVLEDVSAAERPTQGIVADVVWINAGLPSSHPCGIAASYRIGSGPWTPQGAVLWQSACNISPSATSVWPNGGAYVLAHEMTHLFGATHECAPHHDGTGHVTDSGKDIVAAHGLPIDWNDLQLDPGYDDYMFTNNECDITRSPMWTMTPTRVNR